MEKIYKQNLERKNLKKKIAAAGLGRRSQRASSPRRPACRHSRQASFRRPNAGAPGGGARCGGMRAASPGERARPGMLLPLPAGVPPLPCGEFPIARRRRKLAWVAHPCPPPTAATHSSPAITVAWGRRPLCRIWGKGNGWLGGEEREKRM